jgi:hypothetical protein
MSNVCPQGEPLHTTGRIHDGETVLYCARNYDRGPRLLKSKCCPKALKRRITRGIYEDARDTARLLVGTEAFVQSCRSHKRLELSFTHLKRILKLGCLRRVSVAGVSAFASKAAALELSGWQVPASKEIGQMPRFSIGDLCSKICQFRHHAPFE